MKVRRDFEWDDAKAAGNLAKHGVPFTYATRVFLDPQAVDIMSRGSVTARHVVR